MEILKVMHESMETQIGSCASQTKAVQEENGGHPREDKGHNKEWPRRKEGRDGSHDQDQPRKDRSLSQKDGVLPTGDLGYENKVSEEEMKANQETIEVAITFFRSKLEQTIRIRVEDFPLPGDQRTEGLARSLPRRSNKRSLAYRQLRRRPRAYMRLPILLKQTRATSKKRPRRPGTIIPCAQV